MHGRSPGSPTMGPTPATNDESSSGRGSTVFCAFDRACVSRDANGECPEPHRHDRRARHGGQRSAPRRGGRHRDRQHRDRSGGAGGVQSLDRPPHVSRHAGGFSCREPRGVRRGRNDEGDHPSTSHAGDAGGARRASGAHRGSAGGSGRSCYCPPPQPAAAPVAAKRDDRRSTDAPTFVEVAIGTRSRSSSTGLPATSPTCWEASTACASSRCPPARRSGHSDSRHARPLCENSH